MELKQCHSRVIEKINNYNSMAIGLYCIMNNPERAEIVGQEMIWQTLSYWLIIKLHSVIQQSTPNEQKIQPINWEID